jgi:hypothetical protein
VRTHPAATAASLRRGFDHELTGTAAAVVGAALLAGSAWLSVTAGGRLGGFFGICLVLTAVTGALVVDGSGLFMAGVLPPLLLLAVLTGVALVTPSAIDAAHLAADAGRLQRVIAGVVDHAAALVVGHVAALTIVGLRIRAGAPKA